MFAASPIKVDVAGGLKARAVGGGEARVGAVPRDAPLGDGARLDDGVGRGVVNGEEFVAVVDRRRGDDQAAVVEERLRHGDGDVGAVQKQEAQLRRGGRVLVVNVREESFDSRAFFRDNRRAQGGVVGEEPDG